MRILHVIDSVDPRNGGTTAAVSQIASIMTERGHRVEVAVLGDRPTDPWLQSFTVPIRCFGPSIFKYSLNLKFVRWFRQHALQYDLVVINGLWQFVGYATARVMWGLRRPYIVFVHGMLGPYGRTQRLKFLKKKIYWSLVERQVLERAAAAVFTSNEEERLAGNFFNFRNWTSLVLRNSVDQPPASDAARVSGFVARFPELHGKKLILCVGRIDPIKGCDTLLRAFAKQFAQSSFHLVMAGPPSDGAYYDELQRIARVTGIRDQVTWTGYLPAEDRNTALSMASVFVSPSHHENFGIAIVEALAFGVPVILTDKVNIHSILSAEKAAIVCGDSVDGLADALATWSSMSNDELAVMKTNQHRAWDKHFSRRSVADHLEEQLLNIAPPGKNG